MDKVYINATPLKILADLTFLKLLAKWSGNVKLIDETSKSQCMYVIGLGILHDTIHITLSEEKLQSLKKSTTKYIITLGRLMLLHQLINLGNSLEQSTFLAYPWAAINNLRGKGESQGTQVGRERVCWSCLSNDYLLGQ